MPLAVYFSPARAVMDVIQRLSRHSTTLFHLPAALLLSTRQSLFSPPCLVLPQVIWKH